MSSRPLSIAGLGMISCLGEGAEVNAAAMRGDYVACFPDVCFTPPSPPAGWIPTPYANTTYDKDTANASKTVFISGKPVFKKDTSFF